MKSKLLIFIALCLTFSLFFIKEEKTAENVSGLKVLCYGDSITQGSYIKGQFTANQSWVNVLTQISGGRLNCINEGYMGRKVTQKEKLLTTIEKHKNVNAVILFLGVNDLRVSTQEVLKQCVTDTDWMVKQLRAAYGNPKITLLGPLGFNLKKLTALLKKTGYDQKENALLLRLSEDYKKYAAQNDCHFVNLWGVVSPKNYTDGVHPNLRGQQQIAERLWNDYVNEGDKAIKVACVGDSITFGSGIKNRKVNSYPAQLQKILGSGYQVKNFGRSGRTLSKKGDYPYWEMKVYKEALAFKPNYVIIKLGSNDLKPHNWEHKGRLKKDLIELVNSFKKLNTHPKVFLSLPVAIERNTSGINEKVLVKQLIPLIKEVAEENKWPLIDFYSALPQGKGLYVDGIHPNAKGAKLMALRAYHMLQDRPAPTR